MPYKNCATQKLFRNNCATTSITQQLWYTTTLPQQLCHNSNNCPFSILECTDRECKIQLFFKVQMISTASQNGRRGMNGKWEVYLSLNLKVEKCISSKQCKKNCLIRIHRIACWHNEKCLLVCCKELHVKLWYIL